jgi:hypothetical protein
MGGLQELDPEIFDEEAFIGIEEGEVLDGRVVDDLNEEGTRLHTKLIPSMLDKQEMHKKRLL